MVDYLLENQSNGHRMIMQLPERMDDVKPYLKEYFREVEEAKIEDISIRIISVNEHYDEIKIASELIKFEMIFSDSVPCWYLHKRDEKRRIRNAKKNLKEMLKREAKKPAWKRRLISFIEK